MFILAVTDGTIVTIASTEDMTDTQVVRYNYSDTAQGTYIAVHIATLLTEDWHYFLNSNPTQTPVPLH